MDYLSAALVWLADATPKAETVTAIFTAAIAIATAWLARETVAAARATMQADIYERYSQRWESRDMRERRMLLAKKLLERNSAPYVHVEIKDRTIEDIISFFEEIGLLVRKRSVDEELVWEMFSEYAIFYWNAVGSEYAGVINAIDRHDVWYYNYKLLVEKMTRFSSKKRENTTRFTDPSEIAEFLKLEADIDNEPIRY